jgi:CheY-like chemotaxis protein
VEHCIVVVEDEPDILHVLRDVLELEGFQVVGVPRPELVQTAVGAVAPDLFLIDVMLPGMSGIELAEQLRASGHGETPMVAMSASRLMSDIAEESGVFQATVDKPFDLPALLSCVEAYLQSEARPNR